VRFVQELRNCEGLLCGTREEVAGSLLLVKKEGVRTSFSLACGNLDLLVLKLLFVIFPSNLHLV
jgi:hypothetical protein